MISSRELSPKLSGAIRSKDFKIGPKGVQFLIRAENVQIRLIIDNYQMQIYNGLLFGGTHHKNIKLF